MGSPRDNRVYEVADAAGGLPRRVDDLRLENALEAMDVSTLRLDELATWYWLRGRAAREREDLERALSVLTEGLARCADDVRIAFALRDLRDHMRRCENVITRLRGRAHKTTAEAFERELAELDRRTLSASDGLEWHRMWIECARRRGDRAATLSRLRVALTERPDATDLVFDLGRAHEALGEIDEAWRVFSQVVSKAPPHHLSVRHELARYASLWGRAADGLAWSRREIEEALTVIAQTPANWRQTLYPRADPPTASREVRCWLVLAWQLGPAELERLATRVRAMRTALERIDEAHLVREVEAVVRGETREPGLPASHPRDVTRMLAEAIHHWQRRRDDLARAALAGLSDEQWISIDPSFVCEHVLFAYWDRICAAYRATRGPRTNLAQSGTDA